MIGKITSTKSAPKTSPEQVKKIDNLKALKLDLLRENAKLKADIEVLLKQQRQKKSSALTQKFSVSKELKAQELKAQELEKRASNGDALAIAQVLWNKI